MIWTNGIKGYLRGYGTYIVHKYWVLDRSEVLAMNPYWEYPLRLFIAYTVQPAPLNNRNLNIHVTGALHGSGSGSGSLATNRRATRSGWVAFAAFLRWGITSNVFAWKVSIEEDVLLSPPRVQVSRACPRTRVAFQKLHTYWGPTGSIFKNSKCSSRMTSVRHIVIIYKLEIFIYSMVSRYLIFLGWIPLVLCLVGTFKKTRQEAASEAANWLRRSRY
jgi:hypothetical protein